LAYYDSPASVFAAMLAHRTAGGCASLSEYTAEFNRLSALFSQEWQRVTGYQP
ncbi:TPA: inositol monophosphatase, partial [Escherichia coli]|nr:inositol monophosphatase [Escherichia coli]HAN4101468.1 inositol monophosphatase [Escherichia coli]